MRNVWVALWLGIIIGVFAGGSLLPARTAVAQEEPPAVTTEDIANLQRQIDALKADQAAIVGVNDAQWHHMASLGVSHERAVQASEEARAFVIQARGEALAARDAARGAADYAAQAATSAAESRDAARGAVQFAEGVLADAEGRMAAIADARIEQWKQRSQSYTDRWFYDQVYLRWRTHACREGVPIRAACP